LDRLVDCHQMLVDWIMEGKINAKHLVTHRLPLDEIQTAYGLIKERQGLKVVIYMKKY
jgi:S-(hydroxymethyl)glutathione dehydrogenase/alcohol dehydrogenase